MGIGRMRLDVVLVLSLVACAAGCRSGNDSSSVAVRSPADGGDAVEVEVLLLGVNEARLTGTDERRLLDEYTGRVTGGLDRRHAATISQVKDLGRRMRGQGQLYAMANPDLTVRSGTRATLDMPGITPNARLHLEVLPSRTDSNLVSFNISVRFAGGDRENRWDRLRYPSGGLAFHPVTLQLRRGAVEGAKLVRASGSTIEPAAFTVYAYATVRTPGE